MALPENFNESPYEILEPQSRWVPSEEDLGIKRFEELVPPLVTELRKRVQEFRSSGYGNASATSRSLLNWWFNRKHNTKHQRGISEEFRYYFAQREAVETVIYLHDVIQPRDPIDLIRLDTTGRVNSAMLPERWMRYVIKMATGTGKTKVMILLLAWSYFHKLYEAESDLSRNFLLIAPNIIVLDRIFHDFEGLGIFHSDPVLPENGYEGQNWKDDFRLTLHRQDEVKSSSEFGNIYLTNIHRVYPENHSVPSAEDEDTSEYFLGERPVGETASSKVDLGSIVRNVDELLVINDEAHHIHSNRLEWFKSIEDINDQLVSKGGRLSMQIDVTATPKDERGVLFAQIVSDYPLVEAIAQNIVKRPALPDAESRLKLKENISTSYVLRHIDYLKLGVEEWRKASKKYGKLGKKAILFVMTDDTKSCDDVAKHLEMSCEELQGAVLTIHTNRSGDISEAINKKATEELERLRRLANDIDSEKSGFKAIVSVLMLKEGWDVKNVTTIVGLRAYSAKSNILPEQTLGRGLRRMYPGNAPERLIVVGTKAFMDFVESIEKEGVILDKLPMGAGEVDQLNFLVEVDRDNEEKDLEELDIQLPVLGTRSYRDYDRLAKLDVDKFSFQPIEYKEFSLDKQRKITFRDLVKGDIVHVTKMDADGGIDYHSVLSFFARSIAQNLNLNAKYDVIYGATKSFIKHKLFGKEVDLGSPNTCKNLSEPIAHKVIMETLTKELNILTVKSKAEKGVISRVRLQTMQTFLAKGKNMIPRRSVFNRIMCDSGLEFDFARFLDDCPDVKSFGKIYQALGFKLDYIKPDYSISNYIPDFVVHLKNGKYVIIETKGREDTDVRHKMERLRDWCESVNKIQSDMKFDFVYVDEEGFKKYQPRTFADVMKMFKKFKN